MASIVNASSSVTPPVRRVFIAGGAFGYFIAFPVALTYLLDRAKVPTLTLEGLR